MIDTPFVLHRPDRPDSAVIFAVPHAGRAYPPQLLRETSLPPHLLRSSEDAFVDLLMAPAPAHGAPLIVAQYPRAWVDLNRAEDELDPALIEGVARGGLNPRIAAGLGVIPRVVANGRAIYRGRISRAEAEARLDHAWRPYHAQLRALLDEQRRRHGAAVLIDCHSMPHEATDTLAHRRGKRPDVVLGDRYGASAALELMDGIEEILTAAGLVVARNSPFAGAYVTQHYGSPSAGQHVVQVEIDRALYMDEQSITPRPYFEDVRRLWAQIVAQLARLSPPGARRRGLPLAAE